MTALRPRIMPAMIPARWSAPAGSAALVALALALRIHGARVAPPLSGFDGPFHASYIGILYFEGRVPLPHEGWSTHHPPLYYAVCALIWGLFPDDASGRTLLLAARALNVAAGLLLGAAAFFAARAALPARPRAAVWALALALFLPMLVGPSVLIGNEMLATALSGTAVALLLRALVARTPASAALAGIAAGLGVATKLSALVVVGAGTLVLAARGLTQRGVRGLAAAGAFAAVALAVPAPWFARNLATYGAPVVPEVEISAREMRSQGYGPVRPWADYADFHLGAVTRPGGPDPDAQRAVWPVTFSSTWFDPFGTTLDVHHPSAQRMAHVLFGFGALFSVAMLAGARRSPREPGGPWPALMLGTIALAALASYVAFTRSVATYSVLKGTYLSPGVVAFTVWAALGLDELARRGAGARRAVAAIVAAFAACVSVTFWHGGIAPMKVNPADWYVRAHTDAPTQRTFRLLVGREPGAPQPPGRTRGTGRAP
jgi:hypothetical protein